LTEFAGAEIITRFLDFRRIVQMMIWRSLIRS